MTSFTRRELEPTIAAVATMLGATAPLHCIIGGVAVMHHAARASTADVDFLVRFGPGEKRALIALAEAEGWRVEQKSAWQLRIHGPDTYADIVDAQVPLEVEATQEAIEVALPNVTLRVAPLPHLTALKLIADRPRDRRDVAALLELNPDLDVERVNELIAPYRGAWRPDPTA